MARYKYEFAGPNLVEEKIVTRRRTTARGTTGGAAVGVIRIKPVSILWKAANDQYFYSIGLDDFIEWITSATAATRTKR